MERRVTGVGCKVYRELIQGLNEKAAEFSNDMVHVFEKDGRAAINWSSVGTQHTEDAEKFGISLLKIIGMVENFNNSVNLIQELD